MKNLICSVSIINIIFTINCFANNYPRTNPTIKTTSSHINFVLTINKGDSNTSTSVFYVAGKTTGYDNGYDSKMFEGTATSFAVYTKHISENSDKSDDNLAIQSLPNSNYENMVIPIGIIATTGDEISISAKPENFPTNLNIFIEDKTTGTFTNLSESNYIFNHTGEETGRFYIHTYIPYSYTWSGTTNNNWDLASNWNENEIPSSKANVSIPDGLTNYPTLSSSIAINSLTMQPLTTLITNGFDITGAVTYKNSLSANWHLTSVPVNGETITNFITNNNFATGTNDNIGIGIYNNNETSPWVYQTNSSTGSLDNGKGFAVKLSDANDVSFEGTINSSDVSYPISNGTQDSFNLIGNPFTAYINTATLTNSNSVVLSEQTIWLWDGDKYVTYNLQNPIEIAPTQGFFVETTAAGNITFNIANQSHQSTYTFMKQEPSPNFELILENGISKSTTKVFYVDGKTTGFDNGYDSKMFSGVDEKFAVFTELLADNDGRKLAIQTLPTDNTLAIPVGLIASVGEEITFSIETINLPEDTTLYLEDKVTGEFVNLSVDTYKTTLESDTNGVGQFYIHTSSAKSLSNEEITENLNNVSIYKSSNREITITGLHTNATVSVFSLLGKQVVKTSIKSNGVDTINLPTLSTGVYIVKLSSKYGEINKKITLN